MANYLAPAWRLPLLLAGLLVALALAPSAQAAGEYELNDTRDTAYGPLAGGTNYTATFETDNDEDWYLFYIKQYSQMDFSATMASRIETSSTCKTYLPDIRLLDKDGSAVDSFNPGPVNTTRHLLLTMKPGRYYVRVERDWACTGDTYRFRIDPAGSITTSRECGEAIVAKDSVAPLLAGVNSDLARSSATLATKAAAVHAAKKELREASKKAQRLRKKVKRLPSGKRLRHAKWKLKQVRSEVRSAVDGLEDAKAERRPVWEEKRSLEALVAQHQQAIAVADGQIAIYC